MQRLDGAIDAYAKLGKHFFKLSQQCHIQKNSDVKTRLEHELRA